MFEDGLHNRVDVRYINRNLSNRIEKTDIKLSDTPDMTNVPCRIIKDEKVIFAGSVKLSDKYTLTDCESGIVYEVIAKEGRRVRGIGETHHSTYKIRIKHESGALG